ncbi:MAG: isopentenyl phosphate kinase [Chloroflexota bacterium]
MRENLQITSNLYFLKLGGSLITDKNTPQTPRREVINRTAQEIASSLKQNPELRLLIGHGSGSFGHVPAQKYGTHQGVRTFEQWQGFVEVWHTASLLNRLVVEALHRAGAPAIIFPPSAMVTTNNREIASWDLTPIRLSLEKGLIPIIYGDVVFDTQLGGTILSTENLFGYLAQSLHPQRILFAGHDHGVFWDYPQSKRLIDEITPSTLSEVLPALEGSSATDVTGGMASKVQQMTELVKVLPSLEVVIFSGAETGAVKRALEGDVSGTVIRSG